MICSSCRHDVEIARLRRICTQCKMGEMATSKTVSLDALPKELDADGFKGVKIAADAPRPGRRDHARPLPSMPQGAEEYVLEIVRRFADLRPSAVLVVYGFARGWSMARMCNRFGTSKQVLSQRVKRAIKENPWLLRFMATLRKTVRRSRELKEDADRPAEVAADEKLAERWAHDAAARECGGGRPRKAREGRT